MQNTMRLNGGNPFDEGENGHPSFLVYKHRVIKPAQFAKTPPSTRNSSRALALTIATFSLGERFGEVTKE